MPISILHKLFARLRGRPASRAIPGSRARAHELYSKALQRTVRVDIYAPARKTSGRLPLLCFNDGQDLLRMPIEATLQALTTNGTMPPCLVVGIHANENRMQEYGTISQPDYAQRGSAAPAYATFVVETLLPYLQRHWRLSNESAQRAMIGFSLGGLSAFDIAWHYPSTFGVSGVFSGALWWRSQPFDAATPDVDRILQTQVETASQPLPAVRYWFQAGTLDETEDRNNNGIIDAIDDTLDLLNALVAQGHSQPQDVHYHEVADGRHEPDTWAKALPHFIRWMFDA